VRTTPYQKLIVLDVPEERVESLVDALRGIGLEAEPSSWRRSTMACTGIEFCKLAIVETKAKAAQLVNELEKRLADLDVDISVNINGCPNACARTQVGDIGLKGQLVPGPGGEMVEGFQVHLGGGLTMAEGQRAGFGRKLRGLKTTSEDLVDYVERLGRRYAGARHEGETFAHWVTRAEEGDLR
jgi:sulfite reductase (ferredoxin)